MNVRATGAAGSAVLVGVVLMLLGDFLFSLNDAMGKWLVASFSVGQVLVVRSLGSFVILTPMIVGQGTAALIRVERPPLHILRIVLTTADVAFFYAAVAYLPLADVMTFYMAGPIYVAALSHFFLARDDRLAPLACCGRWFHRGCHRAAALVGDVVLAFDLRSCRQPVLRADAHPQPAFASDERCHARDLADCRSPRRRPGPQHR